MDDEHSSSGATLWEKGINDLRRLLNVRLDGMDKAAIVLSENVNRVPTLLQLEIAHIKETFGEQFKSIQTQFKERDVRSSAQEVAANTAVNAALSAQKESVAAQNAANAASITKSDAATTKQIDGLKILVDSAIAALNDKITAVASRMDRGEGKTTGAEHNRSETRLDLGSVLAVGGFLLALAIGSLALFNSARISDRPAPAPQYYQGSNAQSPQVSVVPVVPVPVPK